MCFYVSDKQEPRMEHIAYYRVSTTDQSIDAQRHAMRQDGVVFDQEFSDEGVSGATPARDRPQFAKLLEYIRKGDILYVYAVDRLGRDALDVQTTVRYLLEDKKAQVHVRGLGLIGKGVGELILAVLSQIADMERHRIIERTAAGRAKAKIDGKHLGRPASIDGERAVEALQALAAGTPVSHVAKQFNVSRQAILRLRDSDGKHAVQARAALEAVRQKSMP